MPARPCRFLFLCVLAKAALGTAVLASMGITTGCVDRLLYVKTEPAGARVFVDGIEVGRSPVRIPFEHYGTREVLVRPDPLDDAGRADDQDAGVEYASTARLVELRTPWFQWLGIGVVVEYLWPWTVVDEHEVRFQLAPLDIPALERRLREESQRLDDSFDDNVDVNVDPGTAKPGSADPAAADSGE